MLDFLKFFGTNEIILGVCSLLGIAGFIMTLIVTIKTTKIAKILKYNQVTDTYNKERTAFQKAFEGHRSSIIEDEIKTDKILKDILKQVIYPFPRQFPLRLKPLDSPLLNCR